MKSVNVLFAKKIALLLFLLFFVGRTVMQAQAQQPVPKNVTPSVSPTTQADASSLWGLNKLITVSLTMTAEGWEKATPPQRGGFGRQFGPPAGASAVEPPNSNARPMNMRGGFGFEFEYVHGDVIVDGDAFKDAGVRFKGNSSYGASQRSLKHPFKFDFDRYLKDGNLRGLTTLNFSNNAMDPPQMREALAYEVFRQAGIPSARTAFVKMYLTIPGKYDKQYLGLYTMVEQVDKLFLRQHFGNDSGLLVKPERVGALQYLGEDWEAYNERYEPKSGHKGKDAAPARQRLIEFTKLINVADEKEFRSKIDSYLDVDSFLNFLAVTTVTANLDSLLAMGHNFYMYLNPATNKFVFIPWDLNMAFGGFGMAGNGDAQTDLSLLHPHSGQNQLIERLLAMEKPRETYLAAVRQLMKSAFTADNLLPKIAAIEKLTAEAIQAEPEEAKLSGPGGGMRFGGGAPGGGVPSGGMIARGGFGAPELRDFIAKRIISVNEQLAGKRTGFIPQNRMGMGGGGGPIIMDMGAMLVPAFITATDADNNKNVSAEEFQQAARQFFTTADANKDQQVSNDELLTAVNAIIPLPPPPPGFSAQPNGIRGAFIIRGPSGMLTAQLLNSADMDKNNAITAVEWNAASQKIFAEMDVDKNKNLTAAEITSGFDKLMPRPAGLPRGFGEAAPALRKDQ